MAAGRGLILLLLLGCSENPQRTADLQLELAGIQPSDAMQVRLCVEGVGERTLGARLTGRYAFPGLPAGVPLDVTADVLDDLGEVLAQGIGEQVEGWTQGTLVDCTIEICTPCSAEGQPAGEGEPDWLLAVRFLQD